MKKKYNLIALVLITLTLLLATTKAQDAQSAVSNQNVLVIMVDDLDLLTFDIMLNHGYLPNIKTHLVDKGFRFTNAFVSTATCCPSRATFLTGKYSHNHGVYYPAIGPGGGIAGFHPSNNPERETLGNWMQSAGYFTVMAGKYLTGYAVNGANTYVPGGWNRWHVLARDPGPNTHIHKLKPNEYTIVYSVNGGSPQTPRPPVYQTKQIGDIGNAYIPDSANGGAPFFMVLAPTAPHVDTTPSGQYSNTGSCDHSHVDYAGTLTPDNGAVAGYPIGVYTSTPGYQQKCGNAYPQQCMIGSNGLLINNALDFLNTGSLPSYNNTAARPAFFDTKWAPLSCANNGTNLKKQHAQRVTSMLSIDVMVGQVINTLTNAGKLNNTLIIFTSDNGYHLGQHQMSNKGTVYDEAIRVPLLIRKPGQNSPVISNELVVNIDLAPTILDYAGLWAGHANNMDGRSLKVILDGGSNLRDWFLVEGWQVNNPFPPYSYVSYPNAKAIRTASNVLYAEYAGSPSLLFDMNANPYQTINYTNNGSYSQRKAQLQWVLNMLQNCSGQQCRDRDQLDGILLTTVPRYLAGPCAYTPQGQLCTFDTRSHFLDTDGQRVESITAYGRAWNYKNGQLIWPPPSGNGILLTTVPRYLSGPCAYTPQGQLCKFDTRSHFLDTDGQWVESITAYGRAWNYKNGQLIWPPPSGNGILLTSVPRYGLGPCQYTPQGQACTFDSRSHTIDSDGGIVESITAYGRFWNFKNDLPWP